jgi:elongation factor P--beta-lysine ligase
MDATSSAYSAYINEHQPTEYMAKMAHLTEIAQNAKIKWSAEKRFGKTREDLEQQLVSEHVEPKLTPGR